MSIWANLQKKSYIGNSRLLQRLKEGEFKPEDLAFLDAVYFYYLLVIGRLLLVLTS